MLIRWNTNYSVNTLFYHWKLHRSIFRYHTIFLSKWHELEFIWNLCFARKSLVPHRQPVAVFTQLRDHIVFCLEKHSLRMLLVIYDFKSNSHLVDDSVRREVIFVEWSVKTHGSYVASGNEGADAGALLQKNNMATIINLRRMMSEQTWGTVKLARDHWDPGIKGLLNNARDSD